MQLYSSEWNLVLFGDRDMTAFFLSITKPTKAKQYKL